MKVLFVCDGNICRSPMAAEYLRDRAVHSGLSHLLVESAGIVGFEGSPAAPLAVGDKEPAFTLPATTAEKLSLADYQGKKNVVLFGFIGAFTPT